MSPIRRTAIYLLLTGMISTAAGAQVVLDDVQELDFDRPESWAMKYVTSASLATGFGVPRAMKPGSLEIGFEASSLPSLSKAERTVGFNGTKEENINRSPLFGRPRLLVGLPAKLSLDLGWVPPVELDGVKPNLISMGLGRPLYESSRWRLGARLNALFGTVEGDITCSADEAAAGPDPSLNPFRCEAPSNDELTIESYGLEINASLVLAGSNFEPYAALAVTEMDLEFQLDARWAGLVDRTLQKTDGSTWYATAGFQYTGWGRSRLAFELFYTSLDVVRPPSTTSQNDSLFNARILYRYKIR